MPPPKVSVVMAVHNGERFVREAVGSVLGQTLSDLELVVVDDGSEDSTPEILREFAKGDPRVVVHSQGNQGLARSLNVGFTLARAPLVARLDADDVAVPDRLERQYAFMAVTPAIGVVGGAVDYVNEEGRVFAEGVGYPLTDAEIRHALLSTTPFVHSAVMARKGAVQHVGGYRAQFLEAEDLDLWLRVADQHAMGNVPETVARYRVHPGQATVRRLELQSLCCVAARLAARCRVDGRPDPLDRIEQIDKHTLLGLGATEEEITEGLVRTETWLAKTMDRAGYTESAKELFEDATARSRSPFGSRALAGHVRRERARRHAEQGKAVMARYEMARATLEERTGW
jgi:hypothetical protein